MTASPPSPDRPPRALVVAVIVMGVMLAAGMIFLFAEIARRIIADAATVESNDALARNRPPPGLPSPELGLHLEEGERIENIELSDDVLSIVVKASQHPSKGAICEYSRKIILLDVKKLSVRGEVFIRYKNEPHCFQF